MRAPEKFIVVVGAAIIVGTFALFGKKKAPKDSKFDAPVPFDPPGVSIDFQDSEHFKYRGLFVSVYKEKSSLLDLGAQDTYTWKVTGTADVMNVVPLAVSDTLYTDKAEALGDAMKWVNTLKDGA